MEERQDPLTGEWFTPKRSNQVFANRQNQITYNNKKTKAEREAVTETNRALAKNRKILIKTLNGQEEIVKSRDFLAGAGYDFTIMTGQRIFENETFLICYELGFRIDDDPNILIKKIEK